MRVAVVLDVQRSRDPFKVGVAGAYLSRAIAACAKAAGVDPAELEFEAFYAVYESETGRKAPPIAAVRAERPRLHDELRAYRPDKIITMGAPALNSLDDGKTKALAISKERGRMRLWEGTPWVPTISPYAVISKSDLHRDFTTDLYKVLRQDAPLPPMHIHVEVPTDLEQLASALENVNDASVVGVDVETTGLSPATDELLAVGVGAVDSRGEGLAVIVSRELLAKRGVDDILWDGVWRSSRRAVGHNFKFDMQFLAPRIGWPPDGAWLGDTLLLSYLLDERPNRPDSRVRGLGLKDQVAVRYDHQYGFDFGEFYQAADADKDWMAMHAYLAEDACYTARLWFDLEEEAMAESRTLIGCHDTLLMPVSRALARCELAGAPVDVPWVRETVDVYERRIARRRAELEYKIIELAPTMMVDNVLSPQQVADVMYDEWGMTPDVRRHGKLVEGDRSTDKDHVNSAVAKYLGTTLDRQARWLRSLQRLRRDVRQLKTYQSSLLDRIGPDGRVRASFLVHGTSTGRLSSRDPNLQNVPAINREDSISFRPMRRAFAAGPGREWIEVDYSQLELRVAAALSGDQALIDVFTSGRDIHQEIATSIFSKPYDQITKGERFLAKAVSFGIIYGRGGKALSSGAEMRYAEQKLGMHAWSEDQADAFIRKFLREYPDLTRWMDDLHATVPRQGYVATPYGRRRRFPLAPKSRSELGSIERQAVNTPVQSAASDICLGAMVDIIDIIERINRGDDPAHRKPIDATVLFAVHDSICIEAATEDVARVERICRAVMEKDWHGVPLTVDFEHGPSWAEVSDDSH